MSENQKDYNAADPEQVKNRKEKLKFRELQKQDALKAFLGIPGGRMWMWDMLERCGVYRLSFSTDALIMAFNEGRRDMGNQLITEINQLGPECFMKMAVENQNKEKVNPVG